MASITIKNIGPLSDTGTVELGRFNLLLASKVREKVH